MGHEPNGRRYDARKDESPWDDGTKRKNDVWEDATTRLTSTSSVASLDFGETFVDSSLPFGLLGLATPPRETPPASLKRPSSAPPSLSRSGVLGAKAPQKPASEPPPAPTKKSTPPALPKAAAPPSSKPASRPAFASRPSLPSHASLQSRPALETEREPCRRELTHTAPMASAPARTPSSVSIATPMAFVAPPSFIAPQSRMFDTTPTRPRFIEMREPLPSISVEVESLPPLFTPPKGSELAPIANPPSPFFVAPPAPTFPPSAPPSPLAAFAAANADASGSIPASVMALGDSGPASLSTREVSLAFRAIKPQTAYIWAAAILILGIASGTAFGSHLAPSASASEGKTTAHLSTPAVVAPTPAPPKVEAPPAQPPIEEITQVAPKPASDAKKLNQVAPQPAPPPFVAVVKPAAPVVMQPPTQVGPSRIAVLGSPPSADTKKNKKADKTEIDSAAAAATLADSQRETANAL